jgi:Flp pilus assembly protein TadG
MMIVWKKFCRLLSAFKADRRANVAITFAFASLPILGFVAAAVDYSRANSVKAAMQTALDSTALMLAKEAATDTEDQLKANALKYFTAVFARPEAKDILVNVTYTTAGGSKIVVNAAAAMDAEFTKLLGYDTFHINASSTAKWGTRRLRVALVLDNTGSMADAGKMPALKTATHGLLNQLQGAVTQPGDVYVSIVPFVKDVNLGASNWNSNWIYWGNSTQDPGESDNTSWEALHGTCDSNATYNNNRNNCRTRGGVCSNTSFTRQSTCTTNGTCSVGSPTSQSTCATRGTCSVAGNNTQTACNSAGTCSIASYTTQTGCQNAGICDISGFTTQSSCQSAHHCSVGNWGSKNQCQSHGGTWLAGVWTSTPGSWTPATWTPATFTAYVWTPGTWTPANHNTWNGCVVDRGNWDGPDATYNFDTTSDAPDPVTPRWSSLYAAEQYGSCPQASKQLSEDWSGMHTLVDNMSPAGNTNQAIGLQVGWQSLVGGGPFTVPAYDPLYQYTHVIILLTDGLNTQDRWYSDDADIDPRQAMTCANVKAANVELYAIQVNTGGDPISTLLQNCASSTDKFYHLTTAGELTTTFNTIGTNLTKLRVAQ